MLARSSASSRVAERRTALRYPLRLPVVFSWQDDAGRVHGCDGYCRDLGAAVSTCTRRCTPLECPLK